MRIGIANDLAMATEALRRVLALAPEHEVLWTARDGVEAVAMCARDTPDLILMDLIMPNMGGVEATRRIMATTPCTILVVTSNVDTNAAGVFEAMGYGALDAVDTPALGPAATTIGAAPLLAKIATIGRLRGSRMGAPFISRPAKARSSRSLIAIGASAGGPAALSILLGALPQNLQAAIVVVQHVDPRFAEGLAVWLEEHAGRPVRLAKEGETPTPGAVLVAGTGDHLKLKSSDRLGNTPEPADYAYRPSVDVFFRSVCEQWQGFAVGVLLTGMGNDGAQGLKAMREKGYHTIAQDRGTSAVYGMPKAAAALNAAADILPIDLIAPRIVTLLTEDIRAIGTSS